MFIVVYGSGNYRSDVPADIVASEHTRWQPPRLRISGLSGFREDLSDVIRGYMNRHSRVAYVYVRFVEGI